MSGATARAGAARSWRLQVLQARVGRHIAKALIGAVVVFVVLWVCFFAKNAAIDNPKLFLQILLNSFTLAGLYFVIASGFTLIFGVMGIVNMAHGSFYLLGGYLALEFQKDIGNWGVPLLLATLIIAAVGLTMHQAFLRWNLGQELRQALITIAISIILADQMLKFYGGVAKDVKWPETLQRTIDLKVFGLTYPFTRFFIVICAIAIGIMLWLWLAKTRTGMVIRAGVDDRQMVSALGINIQLVFAITFVVGAALAGLAGVLGGSAASLAPGVDIQFLLNALIVVIIGGMGSLLGTAIGALLYGLVDSFADIYLPGQWTNYSVLLTFILLVFVLAVRPQGLFGRTT